MIAPAQDVRNHLSTSISVASLVQYLGSESWLTHLLCLQKTWCRSKSPQEIVLSGSSFPDERRRDAIFMIDTHSGASHIFREKGALCGKISNVKVHLHFMGFELTDSAKSPEFLM